MIINNFKSIIFYGNNTEGVPTLCVPTLPICRKSGQARLVQRREFWRFSMQIICKIFVSKFI